MSMSADLAIKLAQHEKSGEPLNVIMRKANEIFKANSNHWNMPFAQVDVEFATFLDFMKKNCTQRELDLVYVSENFSRVWVVLHNNAAMGEKLTPSDMDGVNGLSKSLKRLGLLSLITDGLQKDLVELVLQFAESA